MDCQRQIAIDEKMFSYELQKATRGQAGALNPLGARAVQPLVLALAETYADEKLCLVGEAAHIIHPLAGQGFNLGLRDIEALRQILTQSDWDVDLGSVSQLNQYQQ